MDKKLVNFLTRDPIIAKAHKEKKDIYSTIAAIMFNRTYEECLEYDRKGNPNVAGKKRRFIAKQITLAYYLGDYTLLQDILEDFVLDIDNTPDIFKQDTHNN
ncbi:MAG: hypothetical protein RR342_01395 [Bacilli bacterium]